MYVGVTNDNPQEVEPVIGNYPLCGVYEGIVPQDTWAEITCQDHPAGQFVIIQTVPTTDTSLHICGVKVYERGMQDLV